MESATEMSSPGWHGAHGWGDGVCVCVCAHPCPATAQAVPALWLDRGCPSSTFLQQHTDCKYFSSEPEKSPCFSAAREHRPLCSVCLAHRPQGGLVLQTYLFPGIYPGPVLGLNALVLCA